MNIFSLRWNSIRLIHPLHARCARAARSGETTLRFADDKQRGRVTFLRVAAKRGQQLSTLRRAD